MICAFHQYQDVEIKRCGISGHAERLGLVKNKNRILVGKFE